jgi:uncharacterized membrane protein
MYTALFFILIGVVLYGLLKTTEKVLAIRQSQREKGKKPIVFL